MTVCNTTDMVARFTEDWQNLLVDHCLIYLLFINHTYPEKKKKKEQEYNFSFKVTMYRKIKWVI